MIAGRVECDVCHESAQLLLARISDGKLEASLPVSFHERSRLLVDGQGNPYFQTYQVCQKCETALRTKLDDLEREFLRACH